MLSTDDRVELHDKILRGDGEKKGVVALLFDLVASIDSLKTSHRDVAKVYEERIRALEISLAKAKGWIAGACGVGGASGAVVVWLLERLMGHKP